MKSNKETVIIYQTWYENAGKLGTERQNKAIIQIVRYGLYGEIPDNSDDLHLDLLLTDWMPLVDAAKEHRKGGAPKGNQNAKGNKGGPGRPKKTQPKTMNIKLFYETNYAIIYDCSYHHAWWMQVAGQCQH